MAFYSRFKTSKDNFFPFQAKLNRTKEKVTELVIKEKKQQVKEKKGVDRQKIDNMIRFQGLQLTHLGMFWGSCPPI